MKKIILSIVPLMMAQTLWSQNPWWTSSDSVHVFSRNTGSVLIGSYEPLGKLTLGTDALNTSLALVGDYNNFAKNYLKIGVFGRSTDKLQGQAFFDLYHSNSSPGSVGYNFRINNRSLLFVNSEGNVGIGTDKPQAGLDIASAASWGSFKKGLRLAPDNAVAIDAGTVKYGIVGNENNLHFFSTNSDDKVSPFGNAFSKLITLQPKKVVIEGDLEVKGNFINAGQTPGASGGSGGLTGGSGDTSGGGGSGGKTMEADPYWQEDGYGIFTTYTHVALGSENPNGNQRLHISGSDDHIGLGTTNTSGVIGLAETSESPVLRFSIDGGTSGGYYFKYNGTDVMTIKGGSGNVGIATTSPGYKLDLNGKSRFVQAMQLQDSVRFPGSGLWAPNGNLGVGTSNPGYKLDVNGKVRFVQALQLQDSVRFPGAGLWAPNGNVGIGISSPTAKLEIANGPSWTDAGYLRTMKLLPSSAIEFDGGASVKYGVTATSDGLFRIFSTASEGNGQLAYDRLFINSSGNIGIGTSSPTELLSVNGNIRTKKVIVTQQSWSDFVFEDGYQLRPLSEVDDFIGTHRHLPGIPTQKEVADEGVDVGDMQAKLLQKIEELTLYVIQQDGRIDDQQREIDSLRAHIK